MTPDVFVFSFIVSTFIVELQVMSPSANKLFIEISEDDVIVGCFPANVVVIVVEKFASSPKAAANSFRVLSVAGAVSIKPEISLSTYDFVAASVEEIGVATFVILLPPTLTVCVAAIVKPSSVPTFVICVCKASTENSVDVNVKPVPPVYSVFVSSLLVHDKVPFPSVFKT